MTSKPVAFLLADLGITKTHSRPYTSTDNPYSEAQFKTLKYRPGFPKRFESIEHARLFCRQFFDWYNRQHRHSGIGLMTPETVHYWRAETRPAERSRVLPAAYPANPDPRVHGAPAASCGFVTPVSTTPYAIVAVSERVPILTMIKAGIIMELSALVLITVTMYTLGVVVFDVLGEMPDWATAIPPGN